VVNLGLPPGRTLLKVKSKTYLSVLTMAFYWWRILNCCRGNSPLLFFSFFFLLGKIQELTPSPNPDKIWHERNLLGILTYLLHTWSLHCWATQLKCMKFKLPFIIIPSPRITMVL
jgi:hypothetical protein